MERPPTCSPGVVPGITRRIGDLRASGSEVEVVEPSEEFGELSGWGRYLMDVKRTAAAFDTGVRQGRAEIERARRLWS